MPEQYRVTRERGTEKRFSGEVHQAYFGWGNRRARKKTSTAIRVNR